MGLTKPNKTNVEFIEFKLKTREQIKILGYCFIVLIILLGILFWVGLWHVTNSDIHKHKVEITDTVLVTSHTIIHNFSCDVDIICEEGVDVIRYDSLFAGKCSQSIYGCLNLNKEGHCSGDGKTCILRGYKYE